MRFLNCAANFWRLSVKSVSTGKYQDPAGIDEDVLRVKDAYEKYGGRIYSLCLKLLGSREAAEEATARTFVRFYRDLKERGRRWNDEDESEAAIAGRLRRIAVGESLASRPK